MASRKSGRRDRTARASISGSPDGNGPPRAPRNSYRPRADSGRSQPSCTSAWIAFFSRRESGATPSAVATSSVDTTSCPKISKSATARDTQRGICRLASVDGESCCMQAILSALARCASQRSGRPGRGRNANGNDRKWMASCPGRTGRRDKRAHSKAMCRPRRAVRFAAVIVSRSAVARIPAVGSAVLAVLDSHSLRQQL